MPIDLTKYLAGIESYLISEVCDDDLYVRGSVCYDWELNADRSDVSPGHVERLLRQFIQSPIEPRSRRESGTVILVGGVGHGKSTTLARLLKSTFPSYQQTCEQPDSDTDAVPPRLWGFDFRLWDDDETEQDPVDAFWRWVTVPLTTQPDDPLHISCDDEIAGFWPWARRWPRLLARSPALDTFLTSHQHLLHALGAGVSVQGYDTAALARRVQELRAELLAGFSAEEKAWYLAYQTAYALESRGEPCGKSLVFVDNIDHASPDIQRLAVKFLFHLSDLFRCKGLIAIRPLTWRRSVQAHYLARIENHQAPDVLEVVRRRVDKYLEDHRTLIPVADQAAIRQVMKTIEGHHDPLFRTMFQATSGISSRFALRNLLNLLQAPIMSKIPDDASAAFNFRTSELIRAYFFSDRAGMVPNAFENIYCVQNDDRVDTRLLKPRLLELLFRKQGRAETREVFELLGYFGFIELSIRHALNELMFRNRPLIWSEDGHEAGGVDSRGTVMLTPIGRGYHRHLFGEYYYDEVCLASSITETVPPSRVMSFHQEIFEQDLVEIRRCRAEASRIVYQAMYPANRPSISLLHWNKLHVGMEKRLTKDSPQFYDPNRADWIRTKVERELDWG